MNDETNNESDQQADEEFVAELIENDGDSSEPTETGDAEAGETTTPTNDANVMRAAPQVVYDPSVHVPVKKVEAKPPPSPHENLAAKGGSVGAMVLGVLAFAGSFITSYAILNSFMGIVLGLWGLNSNHRRMAIIGICLCLVSAFFCVVEISSWIQSIWPQEEF